MSLLPPVPYRTPIADRRSGLIDRNWTQFFQALLDRVGGVGDVSTNADLDAAVLTDPINEPLVQVHAMTQRLDRLEALLQQPPHPDRSRSVRDLADLMTIGAWEGDTVPAVMYPPDKIDLISRARVRLDWAHSRLHDGYHFFYGALETIAAATNYELLIVTPASGTVHWTFSLEANDELTTSLYEGTTTSADGTGLTELNRNRQSATTAGVTLTHTPTITGDGTLLWQHQLGSASGGPFSQGGEFRRGDEWILAQSEKYLLRFDATNDDTDVNIQIDWYEVT